MPRDHIPEWAGARSYTDPMQALKAENAQLRAQLAEARRVMGECQDMLMNPEWLDACIDVDGLLAKITALIARIEQCLPAIDAGLQCPTCGSREHLDEADICDRCDRAAVDVVRRRMTVEQFIAHVGRVDALIGGR